VGIAELVFMGLAEAFMELADYEVFEEVIRERYLLGSNPSF